MYIYGQDVCKNSPVRGEIFPAEGAECVKRETSNVKREAERNPENRGGEKETGCFTPRDVGTWNESIITRRNRFVNKKSRLRTCTEPETFSVSSVPPWSEWVFDRK